MSEVKRLSLDLEYPFQYREDAEGNLCYYKDYKALKEQFDFKQNLTQQVVVLQKQRDALAAENANLKHLLSMIAETGNANFGRTTIYTPATDAYLNSLRVEGVEALTKILQVMIDAGDFAGDEVGAIAGAIDAGNYHAAQLRAGESS